MAAKLVDIAMSLPQAVITHLEAYAELIAREAHQWRQHQLLRIARMAILFGCIALALVFAGVAVMLWATTGVYSWVLWAVPLLPLLIAIAISLFQKSEPHPGPGALRRQFTADLHLLEEIL